MADTNISTSITERSFDDVIAEFDKPETPTENPAFIPKEAPENKILDTPNGAAKVKEPEKKAPEKAKPVVTDIDTVLDKVPEDEDKEEEKPTGSLTQILEDLTKEEIIFPFDEDKPLEKYTVDDFKDLLKANIEHHKKEALDTEIGEFFESLPAEIQYAAKYVADGGTDLKSLFKALAGAEEIKALDAKNLVDRESIIREYYRAIDWGSESEITDEVERVKELGESELEKLANKFKPKLEKMHDEVVQQQLSRQANARELQQKEMDSYLENAHEAIKGGKIDEVQLDKKTQASLWAGLTQPSYQTRRGAATNELGHLLEKYQYTEPNFKLIYKALWLLKDEKGFEEAIAKKAKNETIGNTVRTLKTEQSKKTATGGPEEKLQDVTRSKKVINRPTPKFLSGLKP